MKKAVRGKLIGDESTVRTETSVRSSQPTGHGTSRVARGVEVQDGTLSGHSYRDIRRKRCNVAVRSLRRPPSLSRFAPTTRAESRGSPWKMYISKWQNLHNSSMGTLSAHSAVILTVSDIVFLLCLVPYDMTNKSLTKVFLRYSLASSVVAHPLHLCYCFFSSHRYPEACHALTGALFYMSKMRAHVAADARVTSGELYL